MGVIWYRDPADFITRDNFMDFFPTSGMSMDEKLNAVTRLTVYFTVLTVLVTQDFRAFYILFCVAVLTAGVSEMDLSFSAKKKEEFEKKAWALDKRNNRVCTAPTASNPFMNVLMSEYSQNPTRPDACDVENSEVKSMMSNLFDSKTIRDVDDIFHKNASDRQFFTNPNTGIPNDQNGFAKWLYGVGPTCKENGGIECYSLQFRNSMQ